LLLSLLLFWKPLFFAAFLGAAFFAFAMIKFLMG
jgi:hypothetical protein